MIETRSAFLYGYTIDETNNKLDFTEDSGALVATIPARSYTLDQLKNQLIVSLSETGEQEYSVIVDRATRVFTINAPGNFSLEPVSGPNNTASVFSVIGYTADTAFDANAKQGDESTGSVYLPQTLLQNYVDFEDFEQAAEASVKKVASGAFVEVVKFGDESFMECQFPYSTNKPFGKNNFIENNPTGVEDLRSFMRFATAKNNMEFIPDRDDFNVFTKVVLEKTPQSSTGTGYKLRELYGRGLSGFYDTGKLTFRKLIN